MAGLTSYTGGVALSTAEACAVSVAARERGSLTDAAGPGPIAGRAQTGITAAGQAVRPCALTTLPLKIH